MSDSTNTEGFTDATFTIYVPPDPAAGTPATPAVPATPATSTSPAKPAQPATPATPADTRRTCVRVGASDTDTTGDEVTTYDAVRAQGSLLALPSTKDYQNKWANDGVTMITAGAINLFAEEGFSTYAGNTNTQTAGSTYTVTIDPGNAYELVNASLTNTSDNRWLMTSYSHAGSIAINDNYTAAFSLGGAYALASGLSLSNGLSLAFSAVAGAAVTLPLALSVNVGTSSVSTSWPFGDTFSYQAEASSTATKFTFLVDSAATNAGIALAHAAQQKYVTVAKVAAIACDLAATVYAGSAVGVADEGDANAAAAILRPQAMKAFLTAAEPVAITVTAVNTLLGALGMVLGIVQLVASKLPASTGTKLEIGDHAIGATTGFSTSGVVTLDLNEADGFDVKALGGHVKLEGDASVPVPATAASLELKTNSATLAVGLQAAITAASDKITIAMGANTMVLAATGITLTAGTNSVAISATGIALNGTTIDLNSPKASFSAAPKMPPPPPVRRIPPPKPPPRVRPVPPPPPPPPKP